MTLRCIVFDLDQTLASTAPILYGSWNAALESVGHAPMTPDEIIALFGPPEHVALRDAVGDADFPAAFDAYMHHYTSHHGQVRAYDGVPELLCEIQSRGIHIGILTGKGRTTTEVTLALLRLRRYISSVLTGDDLAHTKPDPEGLIVIQRRAHATPNQTLMIGDMPSDVEAARAAGVTGIAAMWDCEWPDRLLASDPDQQFDSIAKLRKFILSQM